MYLISKKYLENIVAKDKFVEIITKGFDTVAWITQQFEEFLLINFESTSPLRTKE